MSETPDLPASAQPSADLPAAQPPQGAAESAVPMHRTAPAAAAADEAPPAAAPQGRAAADDPAPAGASTEVDTDAAGAVQAEVLPAADPAAARPAAGRDLSPAACADLLKQHFPALFTGAPKPLKLRIQADINERTPMMFTKPALSAFFRRYTTTTAYLINLGKATHRFDLDGQPAGELSEEHRQLARDELTRRRQVTREREQQALAQQRAQDQQAHQQAHQAQQARQAQQAEAAQRQREAQQERQARLTLLRDFERTTLTMANFCVLKGLKPEALTLLLAQARKEAAEAPPPRPDEGRAPVRPRQDNAPGDRRNEGHRDGRPAVRHDKPLGPRPASAADARASARPDRRPASPGRQDRTGGKPSGPRNGG